jgi:two-component system KDP operon response regulator KdpE
MSVPEAARADVPGRILVVDDEPQIVRAMSALLRAAGYSVSTAATAAEALQAAALSPPDAVVLDLRLPDLEGVEVCRRLREWSQVPVVVVSVLGDEGMKVTALDAGADDYVTKPYGTGELLARLRAAMRRAAAPAGEVPRVVFGDVVVDLGRREVTRGGELLHLTRREYALLAELARHPGRLLTRAMLLRAVWGPGSEKENHYLHVHMSTLRRKIERDPARPRHLVTEVGVGYRLRTD